MIFKKKKIFKKKEIEVIKNDNLNLKIEEPLIEYIEQDFYIFNSLKYVPKKSKLIYEGEKYFDGFLSPSNHKYKLYKTNKNNYYYVKFYKNGSSSIETTTEDEVKNWLSKNQYNVYVEYFGEIEEA